MHIDASEMVTTQPKFRRDLQNLGDEFGVDIQVRFPADRETQSIAVLVTKESHCLEALLEAQDNGELGATIEVVIGNHDTLWPLAAEYGVPFHDIGDEKGTPDEDQLLDLLADYDVDLIALARYMRILSPEVVFRYDSRIINVHPSLLPAFPGASAYMQAIEEGVRVAGVTAHYVTTDLDQVPLSLNGRSMSLTMQPKQNSNNAVNHSKPRLFSKPSGYISMMKSRSIGTERHSGIQRRLTPSSALPRKSIRKTPIDRSTIPTRSSPV